jgi:hypothetical protein
MGYSHNTNESGLQLVHRALDDYNKMKESKNAGTDIFVFRDGDLPNPNSGDNNPGHKKYKQKIKKPNISREAVNLNGRFSTTTFSVTTNSNAENASEAGGLCLPTTNLSATIRTPSICD